MRRLLGILALLGLGCAPVTMNAPRPTPNVVATRRLSGTFALDVRQVPTETVCSQAPGLVDLCVARLRDAIGSGLADALSAQFAGGPASAGSDYVAAFRMVELSHHRAGRDVDSFGVTTAATVAVEMRWQFGLWDRNGRPLLQLAERTVGPRPIFDRTDAADGIKALLDAVVERVSAAMNEASAAGASVAAR